MFDLDEKLQCVRFNSDLIKHMEGKGERFQRVICDFWNVFGIPEHVKVIKANWLFYVL